MLQGNVMQLQLPFDFVKINFGIVMLIRSLTVMIIVVIVPRLPAARAVALGVTPPPLQLLIKALMCEGTILALTIKESDKIHIQKWQAYDNIRSMYIKCSCFDV